MVEGGAADGKAADHVADEGITPGIPQHRLGLAEGKALSDYSIRLDIDRAAQLDLEPKRGPRPEGNHQNLRGQAAGIMERLLQPCRMTDARTASKAGSALQLKGWLPGISPMIWRRMLVPETMSLHELHGVLQGATHASDQNPRARWH